MSIVTIDFETYYAKDFSLSKMTTEEYINDPRFEVIGMGIKVDDGPTKWFTGEDVGRALHEVIDWSEHAILCHNTLFDGAILAWKYGIKPGFWLDTLCMARALHGTEVGGSLASLVQRYNLGVKGTEVLDALGKRRVDFTASDLARYGDYCRNDVELTYKLFNTLRDALPANEFKLIDMTLKMFTHPQLMVDDALLTQRLDDVQREKSELLSMMMGKLGCETEEEVRAKLCSNIKFAEVLSAWGIIPPLKISPATGKETFAFAKNDEAFIALTEHDDPTIQQLCMVRLGTKSTLEESRIGRFIGVGCRNRGYLPIPLRYYGAHTGRWSGLDSINMQNLPSRDKKKKALKNAIVVPPGYMVINCDSSQIEARVLAWLAGQDDVVTQFANGEDVYSVFASKVYNRPISKANPTERFVGKTAVLGLGYGTGAEKLRHTLKTQPPGADLKVEECKKIVDTYRSLNYKIPELWRECDAALRAMIQGQDYGYIGKHKAVQVKRDGICLPNGLLIRYANLRLNDEGKMIYDSRRGPVSIWGGAMVENIVQALARIIVGDQMLAVNEQYPTALTVHDAGVWVVSEAELSKALEFIVGCMSTPLAWCPTLPVACEAKHGERYGDC